MSRTRPSAGKGRTGTLPVVPESCTFSEEGGVRFLHFGSPWVQGAMLIKDPGKLVLEYTRQMMAWLLFLEPPQTPDGIATLGLGAGSLVRYCLKHTPSHVHAVEWNLQVVAACHAFFRLPGQSERFRITLADAGEWVQDIGHRGSSPVLMVDLYDAQARGPVRDSIEFYQACRRVISGHRQQAGVMTVNLFGQHESFERNLHNLNVAFEGRIAVLPEMDAGNRVMLAFAGPPLDITAQMLLARADQVEDRYGLPARKWARSLVPVLCNG